MIFEQCLIAEAMGEKRVELAVVMVEAMVRAKGLVLQLLDRPGQR